MTTEPPKELATGIESLERELVIAGVIPSPEELKATAKGLNDALHDKGMKVGDTVRVRMPAGWRGGGMPDAEWANILAGATPGETLQMRMPSSLRPALLMFAEACEAKLKRNDHKTSWRELPIEALSRLMQIEIEEFKVAMEFLTVADARNELVDIANFAMILSDRLSIEDQTAKVTK